MRSIAAISILVPDYDEAIAYYVGKLGFVLIEDTRMDESKRWVLVAPDHNASCRLLLAQAVYDQKSAIGNQSGGRVFLFLETDDFDRDHRSMCAAGVEFLEQPRGEAYGKVAVFRDLYGNKWDLIERHA